MKEQALKEVQAAIEANTEQKSLDELAAQGKRRVRVVTGDKILEIIRAVVGSIVDREARELTRADRERIVAESKEQFDRILRVQADQDAVLKEQKDLLDVYKAKLVQAEARLARMAETIKSDDAEIARLQALLAAKAAGPDESTLTALLAKLEQRDASQSQDLERRFSETLEKSLKEISRTMEAATARPIDVAVEATDVVIDKLFDEGDRLESNMGDLGVETRKTKHGIGRHLAALKAMRAGAGEKNEEKASPETKKKLSESLQRLKAAKSKET